MKVIRPQNGLEASDLIMEIIEKHMTTEEKIPVCMAFALGDHDLVVRACRLLLADRQLSITETVEALKRLPATLRELEAGAN